MEIQEGHDDGGLNKNHGVLREVMDAEKKERNHSRVEEGPKGRKEVEDGKTIKPRRSIKRQI